MRLSTRDLHDQIDPVAGIATAYSRSAPAVSFERHPAAIERHTIERATEPPAYTAETWFPYQGVEPAELADVWEQPAELAPLATLLVHEPPEPEAWELEPKALEPKAPEPEPPEPEPPESEQLEHEPPAPEASEPEAEQAAPLLHEPAPPPWPAQPLDDDLPAPHDDTPELLGQHHPALPHPSIYEAAPSDADADWLLAPDIQPETPSARRFRLPPPPPLPKLRLGRTPALVAGVVLAVIVVAAVIGFLVSGGSGVSAVFNAPMMVVRAKVAGRVMTVAATAGQVVSPASPLLTLHVSDADGPDRTILAGVHGVIRSVETVPGADLAAGAPLVRLQDCDRAFLTVGRATSLRAGETVRVVLPNLPPLSGTVRPSEGVMEPPNTLVVALPAGALAASCPVGTEGSITPNGRPASSAS